MIQTTSKRGKALALPLAATLLVSFFMVDVCGASISPPPVQQAGLVKPRQAKSRLAKLKQVRAERVAKKPEQASREVAPSPVAATERVTPSPVEGGASLALKAGLAAAVEAPQPTPETQVSESGYTPKVNPYLVRQPQPAPAPAAVENSGTFLASSGFKMAMPHIPLFEQSILPKIQTVYPTGEKPLVVVTFKCPTELVGIDTPSTLILHKAVNGGMDLVNKTNLLSFNMQQVCQ